MDTLSEQILEKIENNKSVILVGPTNSGKTWFIENKLIPFLKNKNINCVYFKNCYQEFDIPPETKLIIIDEIETFFDKEFLEKKHNDKNYYSEKYISKVKIWHEKLTSIKIPAVYILTRNEDDEIENILNCMKNVDWKEGTDVTKIKYLK